MAGLPFRREDIIIYQIGGRDVNEKSMDSISAFDVNFSKFKVLTRLDTKFESSCAVVSRGSNLSTDEIFVAGGRENGFSMDIIGSDEVHLFVPQTRQLLQLDALFQPRFFGSAVKLHNTYYVCGGGSGEEFLKHVEFYEIDGEVHRFGPDMNFARSNFQAVSIGNIMYALGGCVFKNLPVEFFDFRMPQWISLAYSEPPSPIYYSTSVAVGDEVYVFTDDSFYCFDTIACRWRTLQEPNLQLFNYQSLFYSNKIYRIGGEHDLVTSQSFSTYDLRTNTWDEPQPMVKGFSRSTTFLGFYP